MDSSASLNSEPASVVRLRRLLVLFNVSPGGVGALKHAA
jgi:hypothetical protein